jgi:hypothetical protein
LHVRILVIQVDDYDKIELHAFVIVRGGRESYSIEESTALPELDIIWPSDTNILKISYLVFFKRVNNKLGRVYFCLKYDEKK